MASAVTPEQNSARLCKGEKVNELHTGGRYRYYVCPSENLEEVKARLGKIRNIVKDCFVIAIYKGNIISVAEARKIEQK